MAKQLCNACVLQNWTFDSWEQAVGWLYRQNQKGFIESICGTELDGGRYGLTVIRCYNNTPVMQPSQLEQIGNWIPSHFLCWDSWEAQ